MHRVPIPVPVSLLRKRHLAEEQLQTSNAKHRGSDPQPPEEDKIVRTTPLTSAINGLLQEGGGPKSMSDNRQEPAITLQSNKAGVSEAHVDALERDGGSDSAAGRKLSEMFTSENELVASGGPAGGQATKGTTELRQARDGDTSTHPLRQGAQLASGVWHLASDTSNLTKNAPMRGETETPAPGLIGASQYPMLHHQNLPPFQIRYMQMGAHLRNIEATLSYGSERYIALKKMPDAEKRTLAAELEGSALRLGVVEAREMTHVRRLAILSRCPTTDPSHSYAHPSLNPRYAQKL